MRLNSHLEQKTIFFDLGSTLVYYNSIWPGSLEEVLIPLEIEFQQNGLQMDSESLRQLVAERIILHEPQEADNFREPTAHQVLQEIVVELAGKMLPDDLIESALRAMYRVAETHWTVEPDAIPMLQKLRSNGWKIGLISNASDHTNVMTILQNTGLIHWLDSITSSANFGFGKPGSEIFLHSLDQLQTSAENAIMVGDKLQADILGSNQVGMRSIWITRRVLNPIYPTEPMLTPWHIVSSLAEIPELIAG